MVLIVFLVVIYQYWSEITGKPELPLRAVNYNFRKVKGKFYDKRACII
jgi:hypothetical protein